jgi:hypothetical protein
MTRGVLMYAHNNSEIDYFKIACANALMVQKNLGVPVTLVTDEGTVSWGRKALGEKFVEYCFENVIEVKRDYMFENPRNFSDTSYTSKSLLFYNCNHWEAFDLSPYDETLFIDADYLVMSPALNNCWGSEHDVMIEDRIYSPLGEGRPYTKNIDEFGIKQYWATVIYFKKTEFAKFLFSTVRHVQDNYPYYKELYSLQNSMFRNDNAFSIAIHTLNGFTNTNNSVVGRLPIPGLLMAWDTNDIHSIRGVDDITLYAEKQDMKGNYILVRLKNTDVHIMNKWAINRFSDKLIELYQGELA